MSDQGKWQGTAVIQSKSKKTGNGSYVLAKSKKGPLSDNSGESVVTSQRQALDEAGHVSDTDMDHEASTLEAAEELPEKSVSTESQTIASSLANANNSDDDQKKSRFKWWLWGPLALGALLAALYLASDDHEQDHGHEHAHDHSDEIIKLIESGHLDWHGLETPKGAWGWDVYYDDYGDRVIPTDKEWQKGMDPSYYQPGGPPTFSDGRPFTKGEYRIVALFGEHLDLDKVRIHAGPENPTIAGSAWSGNPSDMVMYGPKYQSLDYSQDTNSDAFSTFYHEVLHLWQSATFMEFTNGHCPGKYSYNLTEESKFTEFCVEQQGAIIGDYTSRFIIKDIATARRGLNTPEYDALLMQVVETHFPIAKEMRENPNVDAADIVANALNNMNVPRGYPTYFCDGLSATFDKVNSFANVSLDKDWPVMAADLEDSVQPKCSVSIDGKEITSIFARDFDKTGRMTPSSLENLTIKIAQNMPVNVSEHLGVFDQLEEGLTDIFSVEREEATLEEIAESIKSQQDGVEAISYMRKQIKNDPSLSNGMRRKFSELTELIQDRMDSLPLQYKEEKPPVAVPAKPA